MASSARALLRRPILQQQQTVSLAFGAKHAGRSALCTFTPPSSSTGTRPEDIDVRKLYRDCMKLTYHIAAKSAKGEAMRQMVRTSFKANLHVTDTAEISKLKMRAILGIQNYVIHESTSKAVGKRARDKLTSDGLDKDSS